jgi:hypothetical protein
MACSKQILAKAASDEKRIERLRQRDVSLRALPARGRTAPDPPCRAEGIIADMQGDLDMARAAAESTRALVENAQVRSDAV